jgi:malonyl CoA-acyl carrier protein transacylase
MADSITAKTRRITREQIAAAVGNNPRFIKFMELMTLDVIDTLPTASNANAVAAEAAQITADAAAVVAAMALSMIQDQQLEPGTYGMAAELQSIRNRLDALENGVSA